MRPGRATIEAIADLHNLAEGFHRAARGLRDRPDVQSFVCGLDARLSALAADILAERVEVGRFQTFTIHDPKRRVIHAPAFRERVLHHALMRQIEPALERALVHDTYACRPGRGNLRAVLRVQQHLRRGGWLVQTDVRAFFDSVPHQRLIACLARRVRRGPVLRLCERIVRSYETEEGRGLPIGALTSQHFANQYLGAYDRFLLETCRADGMVRYMDDTVAFVADRDAARALRDAALGFVSRELGLELKPPRFRPAAQGVTFCGFRVLPFSLRLSRRRKRRYLAARRRAERSYEEGVLGEIGLQQAYAAAFAITAHADAGGFRRADLERHPAPEV